MTRITGARTLMFMHNGRVALRDALDRDLWTSDTVPQFAEDLGKFVGVDDADEVLEWLVEHGLVTSAEADNLNVESTSLTADEEDEESEHGDEDGDEDEDDDEDDDEDWDD